MGQFMIGLPPESRWDRIRGVLGRIHPSIWVAIITGIFGLPALWLYKQTDSSSSASTSGSSSPAVYAPGNGNSINVNVGPSAPINKPEDTAPERIEQEGSIKTGNDSFYDVYYQTPYVGIPDLTWPETSNAPNRDAFEIIEQRPNGFRIQLHSFNDLLTNGIRWKAVGIRAK